MDEWNFIAERKIQEAMEEGAFDDLEGEGEPLDLREDPFEPAALRMAHRLLKHNGFAPEWILESKDIDAEIARVRDLHEVSAEEFHSRAMALNRRILAFNLKAPAPSLHKALVAVDPASDRREGGQPRACATSGSKIE